MCEWMISGMTFDIRDKRRRTRGRERSKKRKNIHNIVGSNIQSIEKYKI